MPKILYTYSFILILSLVSSTHLFSQSLVLNEVSNGTGTAEYVEIVVTGPVHCDSPPDSIDIRHWIIDDNNGYFNGTGIAPGVCRFSNDNLWKNIPTGTLIVIYRGTNKNSDIGPDDFSMTDGNCTLILPISSNLFERNDNQPNNTDSSFPTGGWVSSGDWDAVAMSNTNDSYQIRDISNISTPLHSVSYGNNNANNIIYFSGSGGSTVFYFDNTIDDDPFNQNSWVSGSTTSNDNDNGPSENNSNDQTPGFANSTNNQTWITNLSHNCTLPPIVDAGEDDTICGGSATLTATGGGAAAIYTWNNGLGTGASQTVSPTSTTQYIVTMTENGWCVSDTVIVVVGSGATFTLSSTSPSSCGGTDGSITISGLTANTTYQVTYNNGAVQGPNSLTTNASGEIIISNLGAGNYTDFIVDISGCPATDNSIITLTEPNGPSVNAGTDQTICNGEQITLTANNPDGATLSWSGGITNNIAFTPSLGTTTYTVTANLNGCTATDQADVIVNPIPSINAGVDQTICDGDQAILTASNPDAATLSWSGGITDNIAFTPSLGTTTYTVTATLNGCTATDQTDIIVNPNPSFTLNSINPNSCGGTDGSITLSGLNANTTYQVTYNNGTIQGPSSLTTNASGEIIISNLGAGNYTDFTVNLASCSTIDNTNISLTDPNGPTIDAGINQAICIGNQVTLTATNPDAATLSWSGGISDNTAFTPNLGTTTYTVTATLNGCSSTDQVDVIVNPLPTVDAGTDQTICEGESTNLSAINPNNATLSWDNSITDGNNFTPNLGTTTFTVTATLNGCTATDQVDIVVNPNPTVNASTDQSICEGESTILTANNPNNASLSWDNGITDNTTFTPNIGTTTYTVTATLNGCSSTDQVNITVNPLPNFSLNPSNPSSCGSNNGFITISGLNANTNYQVSYNNGNLQGPNNLVSDINGEIIINNLSAGSYSSFVVQLLSCSSTAPSIITLSDPNPPLIDAGEDQSICSNETSVLTAINPNNANISWDHGITDGEPFNQAIGTTTYTVTAELNNCFATDIVNITSNPITPVDAGSDIEICLGESTTLTATGGNSSASYTWSNGANSNPIIVSPNASTTYYVSLTQNGCTSSNSVQVNINPVASASLGNDRAICLGDALTLSVSTNNNSLNYIWNNGVTTNSQTVSPTSDINYSVTISDGTCSSSDNINIHVNPLPNPIIIGDTNYCEGELTNLKLSQNYQTYFWSNGSSNSNTSVGTEGNYWVSVSDFNNCRNIDTIHISPYINPSLSVQTNVTEGCVPLVINFNTSSSCNNCTYNWNFTPINGSSEPSPNFIFNKAGDYTPTVTLTTEKNCKINTELHIKVFPVPNAIIGATPRTTDILNPEIQFNNYSSIADNSQLMYQWNFGDETSEASNNFEPKHTYQTVGKYWVNLIVKSIHSCSDSANILIKVNDFFQIYFPDAFTPESGIVGNKYFYPKGVGAKEDNFSMTIFNRWGEPIFQTTEFPKGFSSKEQIEGGWNGRYNNTGDFVQNDLYIWRVKIMDNFMVLREFTGTVTVIR